MPASGKYLKPEIVARLRGLELRARSVVAGSVSGMHRSAYRGLSVEFAEHRQYVPGDDIRHVDWRIFGRADRFYVKQYEEETNLRCHLLVDASRSMAYTGPAARGRSKYDYAAILAASLAYVVTSQQDSMGLMTFDHDLRDRLPPAGGRGQLHEIAGVLERTQPRGDSGVRLLRRLARELRRRSMVILISDLIAEPDDVVAGIEHLCLAGHELIVLHVMDDDEWTFPLVENVRFEGLEEDERLLADPQSLRESYLRVVRRFCRRVEATCLRHHADYVRVNTRRPPAAVLTAYLAGRARRGRRRP